MSTTTASPTTGFQFAAGAAQERPKMFLTLNINEIGDPATTQNGDGDYEMCKIGTVGTNGSRRVFPSLLFRPEQFSQGFHPEIYQDYTRFPSLAEVREGKRMTKGETFAFVYGNNIFPPKGSRKITTLMAICGGTKDGINGFGELIGQALSSITKREAGPSGLIELTPTEIVGILRNYHQSIGAVDLAYIAKQSTDREGALTDNYEFDSWVGPLDDKTHKYMCDRAAKTAEAEDVSKRYLIGYQL